MSLSLDEMLTFQKRLQEKYKGIWEGDRPETAKNHLLYAVEEIGEVVAILKKRGPQAASDDPAVHERFCEEMSDVFMYLCDVLLCCKEEGEGFEKAYRAKVQKNLERDFIREHAGYLKNIGKEQTGD